MKVFLKYILVLIVVFLLLDRSIAFMMNKMLYKQYHGDDAITSYTLNKSQEDIYFFGGSRASHHYISNMFKDSFKLSAFNVGRDEMTIDYINLVMNKATSRHTPKLVVFDIIPSELATNADTSITTNANVAKVLRPYAYKYPNDFDAYLQQNDKFYSLKKTISKSFLFNSGFFSIIQNSYTNFGHTNIKGYEPLDGNFHPINKNYIIASSSYKANLKSINKFKQLINDLNKKGIKVIVVISPYFFYNKNINEFASPILNGITDNKNSFYFNLANDSTFMQQENYFYDDVHLNNGGATLYSKLIIEKIKQLNILK